MLKVNNFNQEVLLKYDESSQKKNHTDFQNKDKKKKKIEIYGAFKGH